MQLIRILIAGLFLISCSKEAEQSINTTESSDTLSVSVEEKVFEIEEAISILEQQLIDQGLVSIQDLDTSILVDLKYSTTDNFFGQDVYGSLAKAYIQPSVGEDLKKAQLILKEINPAYSLLVFDCARPRSIQQILWDYLDSIPPLTRKAYVADPSEGSIHNYGSAVDLSIFDIAADTLLDMGTGYDHFGYLAYPRKEAELLAQKKLNIDQIENREILRIVMGEAGFSPITSEWWHFNRFSRAKAKSMFKIVE